MRFFSSLLSGAFAFAAAASSADKDSHVAVLTTANFDEFLKTNPLSLVKFMAPWCGHCSKLAPEYEAAAAQLEKQGSEVRFAEVDATKEEELAQKYGVQGFPTMFLFRNGKPEPYSGGRTTQTIIEWVNKMTGPAINIVSTQEEAVKATRNSPVNFIITLQSKDSEFYKTVETVASEQRVHGQFIAYVDTSISAPYVTAYRTDEDPVKKVFTNTMVNKEELERFVEAESTPLFALVSGDNYATYAARSSNWFWVAASKEDQAAIGSVIRKVSKNYRTEMNFVWLDIAQHKVHAENTLGLKELPGIAIVYEEGKYHYTDDPMKATEKSLSKFIQSVKSGKAKRFLKTEAVPETNNEPVKVVVGSNFAEMVFHKDKDVLLEIYAPWCGHCKKLAPIYDEIAQKLEGDDHIMLAKIDGTANEIPVPGFTYQGFPTLYHVKAGNKTPVAFDGARTSEGILSYLKEKATHPLVMKKEDGGNDEENKDEL